MKKIFFYLSYTLIIMHNMFRSVVFVNSDFSNAIYGGALVILGAISILNFDRSDKKKILATSIITLLLIALTAMTGDVFLLTIWLSIISFKNQDFDKLVKYDVILKLLCFSVVITLYNMGLTESVVINRGGIERLSLGFDNPNVFGAYIMSILSEILYLRRSKLNMVDILLVLAGIAIILTYSGSRTSIIALVLVAVLLFVNKYNSKKRRKDHRILKRIGISIFSIMTCISILAVGLFMNNPYSDQMVNLNKMMSGRLNISSRIIKNHGIQLIGSGTFDKAEESTIDNQFIYILLIYGIVPLVLTNLAMFKYMKFLNEKQKKAIFLIMIVFVVCGIAEKLCLRIQYNIFMLYASYLIYPLSWENKNATQTEGRCIE